MTQDVSAEDASTGYLNSQNSTSFNSLISGLTKGQFNSGVTG